MSDYHCIYLKLTDLAERGHTIQIEKKSIWEVTVYELYGGRDHCHVQDEYLSEAMTRAHAMALARWPLQDK